jgi:hypothetical protein
MALTRRAIAMAIVLIGGACAVAGVAMISVPAALLAAGAGLIVFGLLGVDVDGGERR